MAAMMSRAVEAAGRKGRQFGRAAGKRTHEEGELAAVLAPQAEPWLQLRRDGDVGARRDVADAAAPGPYRLHHAVYLGVDAPGGLAQRVERVVHRGQPLPATLHHVQVRRLQQRPLPVAAAHAHHARAQREVAAQVVALPGHGRDHHGKKLRHEGLGHLVRLDAGHDLGVRKQQAVALPQTAHARVGAQLQAVPERRHRGLAPAGVHVHAAGVDEQLGQIGIAHV
jgi:hypothetical protein